MSESPEEEEDTDSPGSLRTDFSPKPVLQEPSDDWSGSPRKRTQTLPTFNCPLTGMAAKADALNRWSRIHESGEEKSGTLSEDIFKILDLRTSGSFFGGSQMSVKEDESRLTERRGSDHTSSFTATSQKPESNLHPLRVLSHQKSVDSLMANSSVQQRNNKPEQKDDPEEPAKKYVQLSLETSAFLDFYSPSEPSLSVL